MRYLVLALVLSLLASSAASAADGAAIAKDATEFAKRVVLAVIAAKDKAGQYPASVKVVVDGKEVEVKVQVTPLAEGFSVKAMPAVEGRAACPLQTASIDVNSGAGGASIVSLVGTAADNSDVVAFATTGTELAVTVTQGDTPTTVNTTTSVADVPAQPAPVAVKPAPAPAPTPTPAKPAPPVATKPLVVTTAPVKPAPTPVKPTPAPAPKPTPKPSTPPVTVTPAPKPAPSGELASRGYGPQDEVLRAAIELAQQPFPLSDGATPQQRQSPAIPR